MASCYVPWFKVTKRVYQGNMRTASCVLVKGYNKGINGLLLCALVTKGYIKGN